MRLSLDQMKYSEIDSLIFETKSATSVKKLKVIELRHLLFSFTYGGKIPPCNFCINFKFSVNFGSKYQKEL